MNTVKVELTESEYALLRAVILDAVDSPKSSLTTKNKLDDLRFKLSTAVLTQVIGSPEPISHDIW